MNTDFQAYQKPMGEFLNKFMKVHSNPSEPFLQQASNDFSKSIKFIYEALGTKAFKPQRAINAANFDAVMIGLTRNIHNVESMSPERLKEIYLKLITDEDFVKFTEKATADEASVKGRINLAIEAFSK
ncbi:hypothetical protein [Hymenobacter lapidarius]|uniref:hypothetical protein n=1 Tax=Hymenobacter lapidarius TaxID=1908237 RepID=UPI00195BEE10|nr:hypothetical protein [Hymenobacter lapidarius]